MELKTHSNKLALRFWLIVWQRILLLSHKDFLLLFKSETQLLVSIFYHLLSATSNTTHNMYSFPTCHLILFMGEGWKAEKICFKDQLKTSHHDENLKFSQNFLVLSPRTRSSFCHSVVTSSLNVWKMKVSFMTGLDTYQSFLSDNALLNWMCKQF